MKPQWQALNIRWIEIDGKRIDVTKAAFSTTGWDMKISETCVEITAAPQSSTLTITMDPQCSELQRVSG